MTNTHTRPFLSVVIANYNYGRFIAEAINSVLTQSCKDFEIIICDGGSTDDSLAIIRSFSNDIAWWCSEKDGGQSDAFNKGFSHAQGRFLTWLNADDVMLPGTIEHLRNASERFPDCEWFVGGCFWLDPKMRIIKCGRGRPFSAIRYKEGNVSVWGPSSFFSKRLLAVVGGVDVRFRYMMDSDLWLRFAFYAKARYRPFIDYAWGLRLHPDAKMSGHNFSKDGKLRMKPILESDERHKAKLKLLATEKALMLEYFTPRKASLLSRVLSMSPVKVLMAYIDTIRFRGKHYEEVRKG